MPLPKMFESSKKQDFEPVPTRDSEDDSEGLLPPKDVESRRCSYLLWVAFAFTGLAVAILSGAAGFSAGRSWAKGSHEDPVFTDWNKHGDTQSSQCIQQAAHDKYVAGLLAPAGDIDKHLIWNGTFAHLEPSRENYLEAWRGLFPGRDTMGGIIQHPSLAPHTASLAVFHQLHCLMNLQNTLFQVIAEPGTQNWTKIPFHTEQCIDYLTQGILCNADTNLEPVDPAMYGHKTAIPKKCRDLRSVYDFVRRWPTQMPMNQLEDILHDHRELERTVYIPGYKSGRFPEEPVDL